MSMKELDVQLQVDFDLPQEQVESFQNIMFDRGYKVGFCSITGTGYVHQFREAMMCAMVKPSYRWITHHGIFPDLQKNQAIDDFLKTDLTHMLFIDHDTVPKDRLCLAKLLLADKPIISGIQAFKIFPTRWSVGKTRSPDSKNLEVNWITAFETSKDPIYAPWDFNQKFHNKIHRVLVCGNGFLLVKREVLEEMDFPCFGTSYIGEKGKWKFQGEDFWFAARCYDQSFPFYAHWGVKTEHMDGRRPYPLRFEKDSEEGLLDER